MAHGSKGVVMDITLLGWFIASRSPRKPMQLCYHRMGHIKEEKKYIRWSLILMFHNILLLMVFGRTLIMAHCSGQHDVMRNSVFAIESIMMMMTMNEPRRTRDSTMCSQRHHSVVVGILLISFVPPHWQDLLYWQGSAMATKLYHHHSCL